MLPRMPYTLAARGIRRITTTPRVGSVSDQAPVAPVDEPEEQEQHSISAPPTNTPSASDDALFEAYAALRPRAVTGISLFDSQYRRSFWRGEASRLPRQHYRRSIAEKYRDMPASEREVYETEAAEIFRSQQEKYDAWAAASGVIPAVQAALETRAQKYGYTQDVNHDYTVAFNQEPPQKATPWSVFWCQFAASSSGDIQDASHEYNELDEEQRQALVEEAANLSAHRNMEYEDWLLRLRGAKGVSPPGPRTRGRPQTPLQELVHTMYDRDLAEEDNAELIYRAWCALPAPEKEQRKQAYRLAMRTWMQAQDVVSSRRRLAIAEKREALERKLEEARTHQCASPRWARREGRAECRKCRFTSLPQAFTLMCTGCGYIACLRCKKHEMAARALARPD
ncbi:hypothetical protein B0H15DRAFT_866356 [Mycena belliarum]|uniref:Uncharacterized protein n=1 Tax=Mycena belliarum TaxID=1033014 RepID=A0AAD6TPG9_9AGAR|nr:hypothetical protein B0H15DRAFT_866356 [Mycena belliae]